MADKNFVNESAKGVNDPWRKYTRGMRTAYEQARFEHFVEEQEPNVPPKTAYELAVQKFEELVKTPVQQAMTPQPGGSSTHGTQVAMAPPLFQIISFQAELLGIVSSNPSALHASTGIRAQS